MSRTSIRGLWRDLRQDPTLHCREILQNQTKAPQFKLARLRIGKAISTCAVISRAMQSVMVLPYASRPNMPMIVLYGNVCTTCRSKQFRVVAKPSSGFNSSSALARKLAGQ